MRPENSPSEPNRRTVLKTMGGTVGAAGVLSSAATSARVGGDADGVRVQPFAVDEKDMPIEEARCWMVNGTDRAVDVYVNYDGQPEITDIQPLSIGPVLVIDGTVDLPYGTYTFGAREKGDPDGEVLASASVTIDEGDSVSAVLHQVDSSDYRMSIYTNDYSASEDARVIVRHCAYPETIDWEITENGETPEVPNDPRSGTLTRGQWQEASDVTEQDYLFEALVDDQVATFHADLEFEIETTYVVYVVGNPQPLDLPDDPPYEESQDSGLDESQWLLAQAFEVVPGSDEPDVVTTPSEPTSISDTNQQIQFDCEPLELYETNVLETEIGATDPDGIVTGLAIDHVDPPSDEITIVDNSVDRAHSIGGTTTATLRVDPDVEPDSYDVQIAANPESLGTRATCTVSIESQPIQVARLYDLVDQYQLSDDIDQSIATDLNALLDGAQAHLDADEIAQACTALKDVIDLIGNYKGAGVSETAHDDLQAETQALRTDLGCG